MPEMIAVHVRLMGFPAYRARTDRIRLEFPGCPAPTVGKVITDIEEVIAAPIRGNDAADGPLRLPQYLVLLRRGEGTRSIASMEGGDTVIEDGDELTLVHRFTGG